MAVTKRDLLKLEPESELLFAKRSSLPVTSELKLTNIGDKIIYYRIKTTAATKYLVHPSSGMIKPKEETYVKFTMHVESFNPNEKHKFMIQFIHHDNDEHVPFEKLWINNPDIMKYILRSVFEPVNFPFKNQNKENGANNSEIYEDSTSFDPLIDLQHMEVIRQGVVKLQELSKEMSMEIKVLKQKIHSLEVPHNSNAVQRMFLVAIIVGIISYFIGRSMNFPVNTIERVRI